MRMQGAQALETLNAHVPVPYMDETVWACAGKLLQAHWERVDEALLPPFTSKALASARPPPQKPPPQEVEDAQADAAILVADGNSNAAKPVAAQVWQL